MYICIVWKKLGTRETTMKMIEKRKYWYVQSRDESIV